MEIPQWLNVVTSFGGLISAAVTAVATIFLWLVTKNLAIETKRMVDASSQPHVVATIDPNRWSMRHADLNVDNTGNATAYDIEITFDPPLVADKTGSQLSGAPFQKVSVIKPGQGVSSYLSDFNPLLGKTYTVTISWRRNPMKDDREINVYTLNMADKEGIAQLGASDPLVQIAERIKKMQEQWERVASGSTRIQTDVFSSGDRLHEARVYERQRRKLRQQRQEQSTPSEQT